MGEIMNKVSEYCRLIGDFFFTLCVIVLLFWLVGKLICFLYNNLFSWPKSKIAYEFGRQYELLSDIFDLIDNDIQTAKCNDNQDKRRLQLKGEILRIKNLLDSCSNTNNISDEEKGKVLNKLSIQLKDFYDRMKAESDLDKVIYCNNTEDINKLCSNIKNMLNEPSESCLTKLKKKIVNVFCNKHKNANIESIKKEINQYADKIKEEVEKINIGQDNGQTQQ